MICRYCGKEYSDDFSYCPYCAEPKPVVRTEAQEHKEYDNKMLTRLIVKLFVGIAFVGIAFFVYISIEGAKVGVAIFIAIVALCGMELVPVLEYFINTRPGKSRTINMQFSKDQTSICPKCGSHNIKIYRKGYNYGHAFWFRKYGGNYTAGLDSNTACCRCMNCGNDWETNYDYRLIKK